jgi:aspartate kinase
MRVHKFGGASVANAAAIRNVASIIGHFRDEAGVIVVSAMGKTTNALEEVVRSFYARDGRCAELLEKLKETHKAHCRELIPDENHPVYAEIDNIFVELEWATEGEPRGEYDFEYDQIVSYGEFLSTYIVSAFLKTQGFDNDWLDIRDYLRTNNNYRNANVLWDESQELVDQAWPNDKWAVTQGYVGCTTENFNTTLGREGSDYTAAILAYLLDAEEVVIWKDVPGLMNADPAEVKDAIKLDKVSFTEAIELAFYGAKVIHPKTLQPLKRKNIPLRVQPFGDTEAGGTVIRAGEGQVPQVPSIIIKHDQVMLSLKTRDLAFVAEEHMGFIFNLLYKYGFRVNLMQNSAVSFTVTGECDEKHLADLVKALDEKLEVKFNTGLEMMTIRHYTEADYHRALENKRIILEQRTRQTLQILWK